jgi:hypothetical protein
MNVPIRMEKLYRENFMNLAKLIPVLVIPIACSVFFAAARQPFVEPGQTKKLRFEQEFVLDDDAMPGDNFFESPSTITCDPEGNIFVADSGGKNIKKFDAQGKFLKAFGREGQGPGEFGRIFYCTFARDHLVVWDSGNRRLCAFSADGEYIRSSSISYDAGSVRKLKGMPTGEVLVEMEKTFRSEPDKPQKCTIDLYSPELKFAQNIYERSLWRKKYIRTKEYGTSVLHFPYSADVRWDVMPDGRIVIGYSADYDLEICDRTGKKVGTISHDYEPIKVTEKDKEDFFDSIEFYRMGERLKDPPEYITKYTEFPAHKPVYKNILVDGDGNLWIVLNRKKGEEDGRVLDMFDPAGKFIARFFMEGGAAFSDNPNAYILHRRSLLSIETGADDLYRIVHYKMTD